MNPKKQYLGFNSWGNFGVNARTSVACGIGRLRNTVGSTTRIYNYCNRTSSNPLACALNLPTNSTPIYTVPSAPTITSVTSGNTQLTVNFTAPANDGGSPITDYEYSTDNGVSFTSAGVTTAPIIITGLTNGTTYDIVIRAINSVGNGASSNSISGIPTTVPSAPTITSVTSGNTQLTVNFTAPANDGGSLITDYEYSTDNGVSFTSSGVTTAPITITGLTNGTTYNVVIRAINSVGNGDPSNSVSAIPSTVPNPPTSLSATNGNSQATISFTPGSNGGSAITDYLYSIDGVTYTSSGDATTPITITGLTNGVTYSITFKAVNANGNSIASSAVSATPNVVLTIETFTTVGTTSWAVPAGVTSVDYLVVGGGGGSGGGFDTGGGGGGGGGMVVTGTLSVTSGAAYSVVVGDGGAGGISIRSPVSETNGSPGESSEFGPIVALGGGGGFASRYNSGVSSQGGTSVSLPSTASTGGSGGGSAGDGNGAGGGGGGNSGNGANGVANTGGNGGIGLTSSISGTLLTYGIGGNGANGNQNNNSAAGAASTGNGAKGGGATSSSQRNGAKGGSGIVILKYYV
jgi:hypothetical protein